MKKTAKSIFSVVLATTIIILSAMTAFAFTSCEKCERIFENDFDYEMHTKICGVGKNSDAITYYCAYCEAIYQTKELFSAHIDSCLLKPAAPQKGNSNACPYCLNSFDIEAEYNNHIQVCKTVYPCTKCHQEFKTSSVVNLHKISCAFSSTEIKAEISIRNNTDSSELNFGDVLVLTATRKNLPAGAYIEWKTDSDAVVIEQSVDGKTCKLEAVGNGETKVLARVVDANGKTVKNADGSEIYATQTINVKGNFFWKIISFFKNLFKINRITVQTFDR